MRFGSHCWTIWPSLIETDNYPSPKCACLYTSMLSIDIVMYVQLCLCLFVLSIVLSQGLSLFICIVCLCQICKCWINISFKKKKNFFDQSIWQKIVQFPQASPPSPPRPPLQPIIHDCWCRNYAWHRKAFLKEKHMDVAVHLLDPSETGRPLCCTYLRLVGVGQSFKCLNVFWVHLDLTFWDNVAQEQYSGQISHFSALTCFRTRWRTWQTCCWLVSLNGITKYL